MRAPIETTTRNLPYSLASAWRYRCTFCGRHQQRRDESAVHMVSCEKNPEAMEKSLAWVYDRDYGAHYPSRRAQDIARDLKPLRVLVARYICKFCGARLADIGGIMKHLAKCKASPVQRGCLSCRFLAWEVDGLGYPSAGDPWQEAEGELPFCEAGADHDLIHYSEPGACHGRIRTAALKVMCADWSPKK